MRKIELRKISVARRGRNSMLYLALAAMFMLLYAVPVFAAQPVILYTDILSGPNTGGENNKGTYLSIFGKNFGSVQGTSKVYINNVEAGDYKYWGPSRGRADVQQITVQPGPNATSGPIRVVVGGANSNTDQTFTVRTGDVYFVSLTGNDSTGAIGDITRPFRSVQKTYDRPDFGVGDTIVMRGGTWRDIGTGDNFIRLDPKNGTAASPMAIIAYPGETPLVEKTATSEVSFRFHQGYGGYLTVSGLKLDLGRSGATLHTSAAMSATGVRIVNNDIFNGCCSASGMITGAFNKSNILGNRVHDGGETKLFHAIYISDNEDITLDGTEIAFNEIYNMNQGSDSGRLIQVFGWTNLIRANGYTNFSIHDNLLHDGMRHAISLGDGTRGGHKIYNNIIYRTGLLTGSGIRLNNGYANDLSAEVYNNTCYDNSEGCFAFENASSVVLRNNIDYVTSGQSYYFMAGTFTGTISATNNLFFGGGAVPSWSDSATSLNVDPKFMSPAAPARNFSLSSGSLAIGAGGTTGLARDYNGVAWQGVYDLGAVKYQSGQVVLQPTPPPTVSIQ